MYELTELCHMTMALAPGPSHGAAGPSPWVGVLEPSHRGFLEHALASHVYSLWEDVLGIGEWGGSIRGGRREAHGALKNIGGGRLEEGPCPSNENTSRFGVGLVQQQQPQCLVTFLVHGYQGGQSHTWREGGGRVGSACHGDPGPCGLVPCPSWVAGGFVPGGGTGGTHQQEVLAVATVQPG